MRIKELVNPNVVSVTSDTPLIEADGIMRDSNLNLLPVVDNGKVVGMITRDMSRDRVLHAPETMGVDEFLAQLAQMKVKEIIRRNITIVGPGATAEQAMLLAQNYGTKGFAVMENGKLIGVVSMVDFLKFLVDDFGFDVRSGHLCLSISCGMKVLPEVLQLITESGAQILTLFHDDLSDNQKICTILLDTDGAEQIMNVFRENIELFKDEVREPVPMI